MLELDTEKGGMPKTTERSPSLLGPNVLVNEEWYSSQNIQISNFSVGAI
jgi:hypothetical protein